MPVSKNVCLLLWKAIDWIKSSSYQRHGGLNIINQLSWEKMDEVNWHHIEFARACNVLQTCKDTATVSKDTERSTERVQTISDATSGKSKKEIQLLKFGGGGNWRKNKHVSATAPPTGITLLRLSRNNRSCRRLSVSEVSVLVRLYEKMSFLMPQRMTSCWRHDINGMGNNLSDCTTTQATVLKDWEELLGDTYVLQIINSVQRQKRSFKSKSMC